MLKYVTLKISIKQFGKHAGFIMRQPLIGIIDSAPAP